MCKDLAHARGYGEQTASEIDEEVREIMESCYQQAKAIIQDNMAVLHKSAELLIENEKLTREEFEALFA